MPPRFLAFTAICTAWLGAAAWSDSATVQGAAQAWFVNWAIQVGVTAVAWVHPFAVRVRYPGVERDSPLRLPRLVGVARFGRMMRRVHPLPFDAGRPAAFEAAIDGAESTHSVTFVIVLVLALVLVARGALIVAIFLGVWNVVCNLYPIALQRQNRTRWRAVMVRRARAGRSPRLSS